MAIVVVTGMAISTAANTKSADQVTGVNQFVPAGYISLYSRGSATGMNHTLAVNGVPLVDDQPVPFFGATGSLSKVDHEVLTQKITGGRVQYFLRNTTGGALTMDYLITFTPGK